jgi:hypothetical protein
VINSYLKSWRPLEKWYYSFGVLDNAGLFVNGSFIPLGFAYGILGLS